MDFLADTQVLIWSIISPARLKPSVRATLEENPIWISQISLFEISIKQKIGKLPEFLISAADLIDQLYKDGFQLLPVKNEHIIAYHSIPLFPEHRDPFDRLILASALAENLVIISADERFRLYTPQIQLVVT
ncbi:type II toxin-antitoxin system VapC family toxin [Spirosoma fluviale]|uniref:PIN domain nuclease, a component of toxin-antitoxin system (PIN domain) n=1 Tax=Spirosoma fluviale TaxID=1597977 RepID=A0A286FDL1_9BACT|nr:type II toxin-antitoxin system VapC family toxin [Spirosoma fluviale]SOD81327.1 PIN domain nuclease, a component of toxin-antitoxin system (PIN domain) [Spirosoma fluviale]